MITLPIKTPDGSPGTLPLPVQLPFDVMTYLVKTCSMTIKDEVLNSYWRHLDQMRDEWSLSTHEFRQSAGKVWPLGLYGDEANIGLINAPFLKVWGVFMSVILYRPSSTRLSRYLLFSLESDKLLSFEDTFYPILEAITVSMNRLASEGVDNIRFLCGEVGGDQSFLEAVFRRKARWKDTQVCFRCRASIRPGDSNYLLYDSWRPTVRTTAEFILEELKEPLCASDLLSRTQLL